MNVLKLLPLLVLALALSPEAHAKKGPKKNIRNMERRYWKERPTSELLQDRVFAKSRRLEVSLLTGTSISDPFLSIPLAGLGLGYHFSEYLNLSVNALKLFSTDSTAHEQLKAPPTQTKASTNVPSLYYGAELGWSLIYGKLALLSRNIFYFDFHLLFNAGLTSTETGTYPTYGIGVGQQIWLGRYVALKFNIKYHYYNEKIVNKTAPNSDDDPTLGETLGSRSNTGFNYIIGLSFIL